MAQVRLSGSLILNQTLVPTGKPDRPPQAGDTLSIQINKDQLSSLFDLIEAPGDSSLMVEFVFSKEVSK